VAEQERTGENARFDLSFKTGHIWTRQNTGQHRFLNFKTGALNHSATLPLLRHQSLGDRKIKNDL
jgi:hypothetical protein